jgi:hypothetical protein
VIRFEDGPAAGKALSLIRVPYFLRVVIDGQGEVDALDQLIDEVRPDETGYVYYLVDRDYSAIVCSRGAGGGCRADHGATYRLYESQPPDEVLRDNERWQAWACEEGPKLQVETRNPLSE